MLQLSEQEGAIYGDAETKNCTQVLHHKCMYMESSPTPPPCGDCAMGRETKHCSLPPSVDQRRSMSGRDENKTMRGKKKQPSHKCTTISREKQNMLRSKQMAKKKARELSFLLFLPATASHICFLQKSKSRCLSLSTHHPGQVLQLIL